MQSRSAFDHPPASPRREPGRPRRLAKIAASLAVAMALLGVEAGCGEGAAGEAPMVKDPAPLPPDQTTEAMLNGKAKAKGRPAATSPRR